MRDTALALDLVAGIYGEGGCVRRGVHLEVQWSVISHRPHNRDVLTVLVCLGRWYEGDL